MLSALLIDSFERDFALGVHEMRPGKLIEHLGAALREPIADPASGTLMRNLDHYIEAQAHGPVRLAQDAAALVADPSFRATEVGLTLEELCRVYDIKLYWHPGYVLKADAVPSDFRGASMPSLAHRISGDGPITAATIGANAVDVLRNPKAWSDRGTPDEILQELKLLWHVLVKYGTPA